MGFMDWFILIIVLIFAAVEALIGAVRGLKKSAIRFVFLLLGGFFAAYVAKLTALRLVNSLAASEALAGSSISEVFANLFKGSDFASAGTALAPHLAGFTLSVPALVCFLPIFLIFKLVSWFLYFCFMKFLQSAAAKKTAETTDEAPEQQKKQSAPEILCGALIGCFVGLITSAVLFMPLLNLSTSLSGAGVKSSLHTLVDSSNIDDATEIKEAIDMLLRPDSTPPALYLFRYSGTAVLANFYLDFASTINSHDIGAKDTHTRTYNLTKALPEILETAEPLIRLIPSAGSGQFSLSDLGALTDFIGRFTSAKFLADEDKLTVVNALRSLASKLIYDNLGINSANKEPSKNQEYNNLNEFVDDINNIVEIGGVLNEFQSNSASNSGSSSLGDIDVDALIASPEKLNSVMSSALSITGGYELVADIINENVDKATNGKLQDIISSDKLKEVGSETLLNLSGELLTLAKFKDSSVLDEADKQEISDALQEINIKGVLDEATIKNIKEAFNIGY